MRLFNISSCEKKGGKDDLADCSDWRFLLINVSSGIRTPDEIDVVLKLLF